MGTVDREGEETFPYMIECAKVVFHFALCLVQFLSLQDLDFLHPRALLGQEMSHRQPPYEIA